MADLTVQVPPPSARPRGVGYAQKAFTAADYSTAVLIVAAVTDHIAVIDALLIGSTAAEILTLLAGTDVLLESIHTTALGPPINVIPADQCIRSDVAGEGIGLKAASAGAVFGNVWYHYEKKSH